MASDEGVSHVPTVRLSAGAAVSSEGLTGGSVFKLSHSVLTQPVTCHMGFSMGLLHGMTAHFPRMNDPAESKRRHPRQRLL